MFGGNRLYSSSYYCAVVSLKALLDNYLPDELKPEELDPKEVNEEEDFINTIAVPGGPIDVAFKYLKTSNKIAAAVRLIE